jgi:hypothetical protein
MMTPIFTGYTQSSPLNLLVLKACPTFKEGETKVCVVQTFTGKRFKPGHTMKHGRTEWNDTVGTTDTRVAVMTAHGRGGDPDQRYHVFESMDEAQEHFQEIPL